MALETRDQKQLDPGGAVSAEVLLGMDLAALRDALDSGRVTSAQIVLACLDRIRAENACGKGLHAVISLNPDALREACDWDDARLRGNAPQGPLAGIPFLAKDNFDTDGIVTSGGSVALAEAVPRRDAAAILALRAAGAILLGKTNMSELGGSDGRFGYSSHGGQTVNPFNPARDAAGSSSGSGVAVAAGFAPFALGTDTSGSIRAPASTTGTVGMRPSFGLISRAGVIPLSLTFDTVGVITRSVADQAVVLDVLRGPDPADAATAFADHPAQPFAPRLNPGALRGARLGLVTNFRGASAEVDAQLAKARQIMVDAGAHVTELALPDRFADLWAQLLGPVGLAEFRPQFDAYLSGLGGGQPRDMDQFMQALDRLTHGGTTGINPARFASLAKAWHAPSSTPEYIAILSRLIPSLRVELSALMDEHGVEALVFATMRCPASVIQGRSDAGYTCDCADPYAACYIAPATGFPEISVPVGRDAGNVPIGISILGLAGDDLRLLNLAAGFERARDRL